MRQPLRPVRALETQRPTVVVNVGLMEEERTMSALLPVARMARPSFVFRKKQRKQMTSSVMTNMTSRVLWPARGVFFSRSFAMVKTVGVLFMARVARLPVRAMLTE